MVERRPALRSGPARGTVGRRSGRSGGVPHPHAGGWPARFRAYTSTVTVGDVYGALWRHRYFILICTVGLLAIVWLLTERQTEQYRASTLVRVQQKVTDQGEAFGALQDGRASRAPTRSSRRRRRSATRSARCSRARFHGRTSISTRSKSRTWSCSACRWRIDPRTLRRSSPMRCRKRSRASSPGDRRCETRSSPSSGPRRRPRRARRT